MRNLLINQNIAQMGGMNIPPAVRMNQNGPPRQNQNWRGPGGAPQRPIHQLNGNMPVRHNIIHQGPPQRQNQVPRQMPIINMQPPRIPGPPMQGYGPVHIPPMHLPRRQHSHPYQQPPTRHEEYDPNLTLEEALDGGFDVDAAEQPMTGLQASSGIHANTIPRNTGYGADTRLSWGQSNLVPDMTTGRRE